jgi:hypothetical protein
MLLQKGFKATSNFFDGLLHKMRMHEEYVYWDEIALVC